MSEGLPYLHTENIRLKSELQQAKLELAIAKESLKRLAGEMRNIQTASARQLQAVTQERDALKQRLASALEVTDQDPALLINILRNA